jgi:hypothetical protein
MRWLEAGGSAMSLVQRINNVTGNFYSDEWYTDQQTVELCISLLNPKPRSVVLCPYDSDKSLFVKELKEREFVVLHGMQNFLDQWYHADYIMTNPPFSIKDAVIERVYQMKIPSLLLLPIDSLGGVKRHAMYKEHGHPTVYIPTKRIKYYNDNWELQHGVAFHSIISLFNTGKPSEIIWER